MDVAEFERIVRLGLGRAILHLQANDPAPYRDVILHACVHNWQYESTEPTRERYLLDLIRLTGDPTPYRDAILNALAATPAENLDDGEEGWDARQLSALVRLLAQEGDGEAGRVLRAAAVRNPTAHRLMGHILDLDGAAGVVFIAELLGARVVERDDDVERACTDLVDFANRRIGEERVREALAEVAARDDRVSAFVEKVKSLDAEHSERPGPRRDSRGLTYDEIVEWIDNPKRRRNKGPYPWITWGKHATDEDLLKAAHTLLSLPDDDLRLRCFIQLFGDRTFPLDPARLIALARGGDQTRPHFYHYATEEDWLAAASLDALEHVCHPDVRALALDLMTSSSWTARSADVLVGNYEDGDLATIEALFLREQSPHERHGLTHTIENLFDTIRPPGIEQTMLLAYEHGPCAFCREMVVYRLLKADALPDWVATECRYDANPDTRDLVVQGSPQDSTIGS